MIEEDGKYVVAWENANGNEPLNDSPWWEVLGLTPKRMDALKASNPDKGLEANPTTAQTTPGFITKLARDVPDRLKAYRKMLARSNNHEWIRAQNIFLEPALDGRKFNAEERDHALMDAFPLDERTRKKAMGRNANSWVTQFGEEMVLSLIFPAIIPRSERTPDDTRAYERILRIDKAGITGPQIQQVVQHLLTSGGK